ncbi:hypothetical protein XAB3213_3360002 [Xanthomonas citri pv. bilvae]|nr:hypothetical protein XAB3213_3360002 [Xanthomonas citri pv. bilvae]
MRMSKSALHRTRQRTACACRLHIACVSVQRRALREEEGARFASVGKDSRKTSQKLAKSSRKTTAQLPGGRGRCSDPHVPLVRCGSGRAVRVHLTAARSVLLATLNTVS